MKKQTKILLSSIISSFFLSGCSNNILPSLVNTQVNFSNANIKEYNIKAKKDNKENENLNFDLGTKNGGSFSVNLKFNNNSFSTKANKNGQNAKTKSDIKLFRLYLINSNASNLDETNIKYGPFDIDINTTNPNSLQTFFSNTTGSSGNGNLIFNNVNAGTYYVAIAAYNSNTIVDSTTNITNNNPLPAGSSANIILNLPTTNDLGRFALSTSGGDLPGLSGVVTIANVVAPQNSRMALVNNGTASLGVNLNLADATGANIDTKVTLVDGANAPLAPIAVQ